PTVYTQRFDTAGRMTGLTRTPSDPNHPATLFTVDPSVGFFPTGAVRKLNHNNGLTETTMYNSRLQPCRMNVNSTGAYLNTCTDGTPGGTVLDLNYGYGTSNNGNVMSLSAVGNQTFSRTYT